MIRRIKASTIPATKYTRVSLKFVISFFPFQSLSKNQPKRHCYGLRATTHWLLPPLRTKSCKVLSDPRKVNRRSWERLYQDAKETELRSADTFQECIPPGSAQPKRFSNIYHKDCLQIPWQQQVSPRESRGRDLLAYRVRAEQGLTNFQHLPFQRHDELGAPLSKH